MSLSIKRIIWQGVVKRTAVLVETLWQKHEISNGEASDLKTCHHLIPITVGFI